MTILRKLRRLCAEATPAPGDFICVARNTYSILLEIAEYSQQLRDEDNLLHEFELGQKINDALDRLERVKVPEDED